MRKSCNSLQGQTQVIERLTRWIVARRLHAAPRHPDARLAQEPKQQCARNAALPSCKPGESQVRGQVI
jgi:hypothetical protein